MCGVYMGVGVYVYMLLHTCMHAILILSLEI